MNDVKEMLAIVYGILCAIMILAVIFWRDGNGK